MYFFSLDGYFLFLFMYSGTSVYPLGGYFSLGFQGFSFSLFPCFIGSFSLWLCSPFFLLGCVHLSRILLLQGEHSVFSFVKEVFLVRSLDSFSLILLSMGSGFLLDGRSSSPQGGEFDFDSFKLPSVFLFELFSVFGLFPCQRLQVLDCVCVLSCRLGSRRLVHCS